MAVCVGVSGFMQHGVINYHTDECCDPEQKAECVEQVDKPCQAMRLLLVAQRQNRSSSRVVAVSDGCRVYRFQARRLVFNNVLILISGLYRNKRPLSD